MHGDGERTDDASQVTSEGEAHGLTWGVRGSFVGYIAALPDGRIAVSDPATITAEGSFHFPYATMVDGEGERWIRCAGGVRFSGHFGMLEVPLQNLSVRVLPNGAELFTEQSDGSVFSLADIAFTEPVTSESAIVWEAAPVMLTEAGSRFFGTQYPAGTEMAPLRMSLPVAPAE